MSFMNKKTIWTNAEFIPLKICIASIYLIIGAYFSNFVMQYKWFFIVLFLGSLGISMYKWISKMKQAQD